MAPTEGRVAKPERQSSSIQTLLSLRASPMPSA